MDNVAVCLQPTFLFTCSRNLEMDERVLSPKLGASSLACTTTCVTSTHESMQSAAVFNAQRRGTIVTMGQ